MTAGGIPFTGNGARLSPGRALLCGLALLLCGGEALARQLPSDMLVGFVASAQYPVITLKKPKQSLLRSVLTLGLGKKTVSYSVAPSVRIRTAQNLFIVYGRMPQLQGQFRRPEERQQRAGQADLGAHREGSPGLRTPAGRALPAIAAAARPGRCA